MLRALSKPLNMAAGVGAAALGLAAGAMGFPEAANDCKSQVKKAYRQFMPCMDYPDLSKHNNCLSKVLTPQMYTKLRDLVSSTFPFAFFSLIYKQFPGFAVYLFWNWLFTLYTKLLSLNYWTGSLHVKM